MHMELWRGTLSVRRKNDDALAVGRVVGPYGSALDGTLKMRLLNNVWCVACRATTTIVQFTGRIEQGDLVLHGRCISCGGPVARVIEGA